MKLLKDNMMLLVKASRVYRAAKHPLRLKLLELLNENKEMNVTDIHLALRIDQSAASQHLSTLRNAGLVIARREGKMIFYSVNMFKIKRLITYSEDLLV